MKTTDINLWPTLEHAHQFMCKERKREGGGQTDRDRNRDTEIETKTHTERDDRGDRGTHTQMGGTETRKRAAEFN